MGGIAMEIVTDRDMIIEIMDHITTSMTQLDDGLIIR